MPAKLEWRIAGRQKVLRIITWIKLTVFPWENCFSKTDEKAELMPDIFGNILL